MKRIFSIFVALATCVIVTADNITRLVLELNDGTKNEFVFSETPIITMPDNSVKVSSNSLTVGFKRSDVNRFYFRHDETAINALKADGNNVKFNCLDKNTIIVSGLEAGQNIRVYNISGQLLNSCSEVSNGEANISLIGLNGGTYIIKCGNKSFKIRL